MPKSLSMMIISLAILGITSGCAMNPNKKKLVVLQNPETKQTVQCTADAWTTWNVYAQVEECAKAYEKGGYKRLGDY